MAKLNFLIQHCTATPAGREVTRNDIIQWHMNERGWDRLGYSDMVHLDGSLENLTPFNQDDEVDSDEMTWGVAGKNSVSRHIVYVGGFKGVDTRTSKQLSALATYYKYTVLRHPHILIAGHNQFSSKACPSFDVPEFCRSIGIPETNIYDPEILQDVAT